MNRKRALLTSGSIILLCTAIIVGFTFALFTEEISLKNHLQAGEMNLTLARTELEYTELDASGNLVKRVNKTPVNYTPGATDASDTNVFGLDNGIVKMVPQSYRKATMTLTSPVENDVAFDYNVQLKLDAESDELFAKQLLVTVVDYKGRIVVNQKPLNEFYVVENGDYSITSGTMEAAAEVTTHTFTVTILFDDNTTENNKLHSEEVSFDLYIVATQRTAELGTAIEDTTAAETTVENE